MFSFSVLANEEFTDQSFFIRNLKDKVNLLNNRIAERVLLGDHYVRPDIVEQRYIAGLKLLDHYFEYPDVLELFDNSKTMLLVVGS